MTTQRTILWTVTDPRGLNISMAEDVWQTILAKHRDLAPYFDAVKQTAENPDAIYFDPETTAQRQSGAKIYWYYKSQLLTGDLADNYTTVVVKVVSEVGGNHGHVQSAWAPERVQPRLVLEWKK